MPTPDSQVPPAARAQGGVPAVGARSMARGSSRPGRPRFPVSWLRALCALGTFGSRWLPQRLPFRLRVGSGSGSAGYQIPAATSFCRGEAAASLPPSGARSQHRGNHGDGAHPGRAASLKGQASRRGIPPSPRDLVGAGEAAPSLPPRATQAARATPSRPARPSENDGRAPGPARADSAAGARRLSLQHGGSQRAWQPLLPRRDLRRAQAGDELGVRGLEDFP